MKQKILMMSLDMQTINKPLIFAIKMSNRE